MKAPLTVNLNADIWMRCEVALELPFGDLWNHFEKVLPPTEFKDPQDAIASIPHLHRSRYCHRWCTHHSFLDQVCCHNTTAIDRDAITTVALKFLQQAAQEGSSEVTNLRTLLRVMLFWTYQEPESTRWDRIASYFGAFASADQAFVRQLIDPSLSTVILMDMALVTVPHILAQGQPGMPLF